MAAFADLDRAASIFASTCGRKNTIGATRPSGLVYEDACVDASDAHCSQYPGAYQLPGCAAATEISATSPLNPRRPIRLPPPNPIHHG